jgi:hypothetical protein
MAAKSKVVAVTEPNINETGMSGLIDDQLDDGYTLVNAIKTGGSIYLIFTKS